MTAVIVIVVILVIAALAASAVVARRQRLRRRFGPEYDRTVEEQSSTFRAEAELAERQRRVRKLHIRPLSDEARRGYAADWLAIQENFVNSPQAAVSEAYELVTRVMADRGYPAADDDQAIADLSVDHAQTVGHFRAAREITQDVTGSATPSDEVTEELRQALIHYRALFSDLLGEPSTNGNAAPVSGAVTAQGAALSTGAGSATAQQTSGPTPLSGREAPEDPVTDDEPQSTWR
jgi:hypothetical protein